MRARPFEDLGFARVDHHRGIRQGFPEVVLGLGKTPAQIAAIAAEIVGRGSTLLVTRATDAGLRRRACRGPGATYHADAALITFRQQDVAPGKGTIVVASAGTSDLPVAEEAALTAELMGNDVERLYDVGVAGLHRLLGERAALDGRRASSSSSPAWKARCPASSPGLVSVPGDRRADQRRLRRQLRRHRGAARHAEQLRVRACRWSTSTTASAPPILRSL